jgi:hypothetical protein
VRLLLDTHIALWAVTASTRLSAPAGALLMQADEVFACNSLRLVMPVCNLGGSGRAACSALALALRDHVLGAYGAALPMPAWIECS